jgi:hypothetical protein
MASRAGDDGAIAVLVVEDQAHLPHGHYAVRGVELAGAFAALGHRSTLLTSRGRAGEQPLPFPVATYGPVARGIARLGAHARVLAMVGTARARRRHGDADVVVLISFAVDPVLAAACCGRGDWLLYQFAPPLPHRRQWLARAVDRAARRAELRRRRHGGQVRIGVAAAWADDWAEQAPFLRPAAVAIAGTTARAPIAGARERLGITGDDRVALVFGAVHDGKDARTPTRAFAGLAGWQLVVGGQLGGGAVDETTRELLYSAADVVVLSFVDGYASDSGTLMDAVSWGVPVVCSARSAAAEVVRQYGLGTLFEPGDADALRAALARVPARVDPANLARAREELSNLQVASAILGLFGRVPTAPTAPGAPGEPDEEARRPG